MREERFRRWVKRLASIVPIYGFMFFFGPVAWQLWMALRLDFISLEEARRCVLSPCTVSISGVLFVLDTASLAWGMGRVGAGEDGKMASRMAVHCVSLLMFATIGTVASMSTLSGAYGGRVFPPLKIMVGALNGTSMCCVFFADATVSVATLIVPPGRPVHGTKGGILSLTRSFNAWLFALGLPLFIVSSLVAASMGGRAMTGASMPGLIVSMAMPVTMGSLLCIRADKRITVLRGSVGKESTQ